MARLIAQTRQTDGKTPRTEFAVDDDLARFISHIGPVFGRKLGDDIADMRHVATATLGQRSAAFDQNLIFVMEQPPDDFFKRKRRIA